MTRYRTTLDDWHPGEAARLPAMIARVRRTHGMDGETRLRSGLYVMLQDVKNVRLGDSLDPIADRILALVRQAMTSEAAVEAAGRMMWERHLRPTEPVWGVDHSGIRVMYREEAKDSITAALDAAGITEDHQS